MRTYLTRLTMAAAGAMLTGVSLAGVAHADDDGIYHLDPSVLEDVGNLEPCDEISASEDILFPVDPNWEPGDVLPPTEPEDPETPLIPDGIELVPCYQIADPDGNGNGGGGNGGGGNGNGNGGGGGNGNGNGGGGNGGGGNGGGNGGGGNGGQSGGGQPGGGSNGESGQSSTGSSDGDDGEGSDEVTDDPTQQTETTTPTAATGNDDNGALMLAIVAGVLGALGLFIIAYGLRKRPRRGQQPA